MNKSFTKVKKMKVVNVNGTNFESQTCIGLTTFKQPKLNKMPPPSSLYYILD
jgi:hypothetical protein